MAVNHEVIIKVVLNTGNKLVATNIGEDMCSTIYRMYDNINDVVVQEIKAID